MNGELRKRFKHPLLLEKIAGTLHIAIGYSYQECYVDDPATERGAAELKQLREEGQCNVSSRHVDIVADFRPGGCGRAVYLDDVRVTAGSTGWLPPEPLSTPRKAD
jgi:leucyl aminopeptidase (aminopeptidase T)